MDSSTIQTPLKSPAIKLTLLPTQGAWSDKRPDLFLTCDPQRLYLRPSPGWPLISLDQPGVP
ncbi:hypothetical protein E2C01_088483 [Portunus trituberculatus]|uniref:Uncharacterized protein n=1 Tax=Portunus trituberculatus TaxID=210409 RepID=A0A5B7JJZ7_PORTR|nr:hypothetical protein [Portunus trituberculatus]